jgi:hypothetical protein
MTLGRNGKISENFPIEPNLSIPAILPNLYFETGSIRITASSTFLENKILLNFLESDISMRY